MTEPTHPQALPQTIILECTDCDREIEVARQKTDPTNAARMVLQCDRCDDGDRHSPAFFDVRGRWISPIEYLPEI